MIFRIRLCLRRLAVPEEELLFVQADYEAERQDEKGVFHEERRGQSAPVAFSQGLTARVGQSHDQKRDVDTVDGYEAPANSSADLLSLFVLQNVEQNLDGAEGEVVARDAQREQ